MNIYVGLDLATVSGLAIYIPNNPIAIVHQHKGNAIQQLNTIKKLLNVYIYNTNNKNNNSYIFIIEELHTFRNGNTTRFLLEMTGYIKYSLIDSGYRVVDVAPSEVRKYLGTKDKKGTLDFFLPRYTGSNLTNNHTDALGLAIYQAAQDGHIEDFSNLQIHGIGEWM